MRQAFHIFAKDVRQLWFAMAMVLAITAFAGFLDTDPFARLPDYVPEFAFNSKPLIDPDLGSFGGAGIGAFESFSNVSLLPALLVFAWCYLIALAVHTDTIPGDRQFWLTRPYDRRSLWGAKALFAAAFVNLPIFLAQSTMLIRAGFPVAASLPALLCEQLLVTLIVVLPAMAVAAMTRTMTPFVLLLIVAGLEASGFAALLMFPFLPYVAPYPPDFHVSAFNWIPDGAGIIVIAAASIAILFVQFMRRRTAVARLLAAIGTAVAFVVFSFLPWTAVFAIQSLLGARLESQPRAEIVRPPPATSPARGISDTLDLLMRISGVPSGTLIACDAATLRVDGAPGAVWSSPVVQLDSRISQAPDGCRVQAQVNQAFFNRFRDRQVAIHGALYLTVFGGESATPMVPGHGAVTIPGVGICRAAVSQKGVPAVTCRDAFRRPRLLAWTRDDSGRGERLSEAMSYSPLPAELRVMPFDTLWAKAFLNPAGGVTLVTQQPLAHLWTQADLRDVRLGDVEFGSR